MNNKEGNDNYRGCRMFCSIVPLDERTRKITGPSVCLKSLNLDQLRHLVSWKFDQLSVDLLGDWICCRKVGIKVLNENEPQTWEISEPQKQFQFFKNGRFINWKNLGLCWSFLFRRIILCFKTSSFQKTWATVGLWLAHVAACVGMNSSPDFESLKMALSCRILFCILVLEYKKRVYQAYNHFLF